MVWLEGLLVSSKPACDLPSIKDCLCRSQLLDEVLCRRSVDQALCDWPLDAPAPLWTELNGFCFQRAGLQSLQSLSRQSCIIESILSPCFGGDLLLFLELSRLYKCLEAAVDVLIIMFQSKGADGGLAFSFLRNIKGECLLESLEFSNLEDSGAVEIAVEAILALPHVIHVNDASFEGPTAHCLRHLLTADSPSVGIISSLELMGFLCFNRIVNEWGPGPFGELFSANNFSDLTSTLTLKAVRVLKLQQFTERLRRKCMLSAAITAGYRLVATIEDCIFAFDAEPKNSMIARNLNDDLRAAWTLVFECSRAIGSFDEALSALKAMRDIGASDTQVDVNLTSLLISACENGGLEWICEISGLSGISIASHIERLHLTSGLSKDRVFLDCAFAYLILKRHSKDAARVADSVASSDLFAKADFSIPLRLLAVAILSLRSLPSDQAYILYPKSDNVVARKRHIDGEVASNKDLGLHMRSLPAIVRDFVLVYSKSLLTDISDSLCTVEYVLKELIASERYHDAFYLAVSSDLVHLLQNLFRVFPLSEVQNASETQTLDSVSGYFASSLSSAQRHQRDDDALRMLGKLPKPCLCSALTICELTLGNLLSICDDEIILRSLIIRGDTVTACKIAVHALSPLKTKRLSSYSTLDELIIKCRLQLELDHGGQLYKLYPLLLHSIRNHFLSLMVA